MKRFFTILCVFCMAMLTACTDIRTRKYADVMIVQSGADYHAAMRCSDADTWFSAVSESCVGLHDALECAVGADIGTGHLALVMLQGDSLAPLREWYAAGLLAPTCPVLLCADDINAKKLADTNISARLELAFQNGHLPRITVGDVLGNIKSRAAMTILPYFVDGTLTLAVHDGSQICGICSADACRGAALLGGQFDAFMLSKIQGNTGEIAQIRSCRNKITCGVSDSGMSLTVNIKIRTDTKNFNTAAQIAQQDVTAFFDEAVTKFGADTCFLEESAYRCRIEIPAADAWRKMLRSAHVYVIVS